MSYGKLIFVDSLSYPSIKTLKKILEENVIELIFVFSAVLLLKLGDKELSEEIHAPFLHVRKF